MGGRQSSQGSGTWYDVMDRIWDYALANTPCNCGQDHEWSQSIKGDISCRSCGWTLTIQRKHI